MLFNLPVEVSWIGAWSNFFLERYELQDNKGGCDKERKPEVFVLGVGLSFLPVEK